VRDAGFEKARHVPVMLSGLLVAHQHAHVTAEHFGGGVAEQALGAVIEGLDHATMVDEHHAIDRRIEDRLHSHFADGRRFAHQSPWHRVAQCAQNAPRDSVRTFRTGATTYTRRRQGA
jgi:hypothetical protein